ncbi:MAG: DUF885 domain-containing protein [Robiginitomaculum sp.]|nr:MAG: DUF885 domain-containing protein [Robiginitomaculum sp.]
MKQVFIGILVAGFIAFGASAVRADANEDLHALIEQVRALDLANDPVSAGQEGDAAALSKLPDISAGSTAAEATQAKVFADRLQNLPRGELTAANQINADLLDFVLQSRVAGSEFDQAAMPFTNDSGFHTYLDYVARSTRVTNVSEGEAWIARLNQVPEFLSAHRTNIARGLKSGFAQPKMIVQSVAQTMSDQLEGEAMLPSLLAPLDALPASVSEADKARLRAGIEQAFAEAVRPAFAQTLTFLQDEVLPKSRDSIGISDVPGGREYYESRVKYFTTTNMSAAEVHELGKSEVARIRAEMEVVIEQSGFTGSFAEFLQFLRTDPQFYAKTEQELLMRASFIAKQVDDKMPQFFGFLPRLPYGVRPVPAAIAPHYTTARYWPGDSKTGRAGGYMVNTYDLKSRPLYELPALTMHEAVPGHHHQFAIAEELKDVPAFRNDLYVVAFGEGWGLYTEKLGVEMGMYKTPYENFGRLTYEMWRACRLVMDTGIHAFGWTKDQAKACLIDNSALALHNIETETNRYISWPGQALGYKIGELTIWRLRHKAEAELGGKFDLRAFHDEVLKDGSVTLTMLESKIDRWIAEVEAKE